MGTNRQDLLMSEVSKKQKRSAGWLLVIHESESLLFKDRQGAESRENTMVTAPHS